jgi:hypothetical protein
MITLPIEQGTPEWFEYRRQHGMASESCVVAVRIALVGLARVTLPPPVRYAAYYPDFTPIHRALSVSH